MARLTIGIVGKTNTGKTTFFNAATLLNAEVQPYPFTTKEPNKGIAHISAPCVCKSWVESLNYLNLYFYYSFLAI